MNTQLAFFDAPAPAPAQMHSATSREAARLIEPKAGTFRGIVLDCLRRVADYGATDDEMQIALALNPSTQRPRRVELVEAGLVYDSGRIRRTQSGRNAVVWVAQ